MIEPELIERVKKVLFPVKAYSDSIMSHRAQTLTEQLYPVFRDAVLEEVEKKLSEDVEYAEKMKAKADNAGDCIGVALAGGLVLGAMSAVKEIRNMKV